MGTFGVLGLLNGACGAIKGGRFDGWGYVAAVHEDGKLVRFELTE